jgi:hypothetical protein
MPSHHTQGDTMLPNFDRRTLIRAVAGTCAGLIVVPRLAAQQPSEEPPRPDPLGKEQVNEFVRVAHANLDKTRVMLDQEPRLIKSAWDWGGGDFESALGAAGHMGRRDIAQFLLARGAPLELCAAAMLGQLAIIRAALDTQPSLLHVPGPHGIPLIAHAQRGGEQAAETLAYLTDLAKRHPKPGD